MDFYRPLSDWPKALHPTGEPVEQGDSLPHMIAKAIELYKDDCRHGGGTPSRTLINKLRRFRLDLLTRDEWFSIADAMSGCAPDDLSERFHRYAEEQWHMLSLAVQCRKNNVVV